MYRCLTFSRPQIVKSFNSTMARTEEQPTITLNPLSRSDGSAQWQFRRVNVIAGVNGPMDPARIRDELPSEAYIEVVVRPAVGVTSTSEKYLEERIKQALKPIIIRTLHPRKLIQIIVQIVEVPDGVTATALLPTLINTATLALLAAGTPLSTTLFSTSIVQLPDGELVCEPTATDVVKAQSVYGLGFENGGNLSFVDSSGDFDEGDWERIVEAGREFTEQNVEKWIRSAVTAKLEKDFNWRK